MVSNSTDFDVFGNNFSAIVARMEESDALESAAKTDIEWNRQQVEGNSGGIVTYVGDLENSLAMTTKAIINAWKQINGDPEKKEQIVENFAAANNRAVRQEKSDQEAKIEKLISSGLPEAIAELMVNNNLSEQDAKKVIEKHEAERAEMAANIFGGFASAFGEAAETFLNYGVSDPDGRPHDHSEILSPLPNFMPDNAMGRNEYIDFSGFMATVEHTEDDVSPGQNFAPRMGIPQGVSRGSALSA